MRVPFVDLPTDKALEYQVVLLEGNCCHPVFMSPSSACRWAVKLHPRTCAGTKEVGEVARARKSPWLAEKAGVKRLGKSCRKLSRVVAAIVRGPM